MAVTPVLTASAMPTACNDANCAGGACASCCTPEHKCAVGEGGCNSDDDCLPGLQCARENCRSEFGWVNGEEGTNCCAEYCTAPPAEAPPAEAPPAEAPPAEVPVYRGSTNVTKDGTACVRWDLFGIVNYYPDSFLEGNYCRNTENNGDVWCFTDEGGYDYGICDVPLCPTSTPSGLPSLEPSSSAVPTVSAAPSPSPTASSAPSSSMPTTVPTVSAAPSPSPTASSAPTSSMPTKPFADRGELKAAVDRYVGDVNCAKGNDCAVGEMYGWPMNSWCVSDVTDMHGMFDIPYELSLWTGSFNEDISSWDVSRVTDMKRMFRSASAFNSDISEWDVSRVTDMYGMFGSAFAFNGNISEWNVSRVTDMSSMFLHAIAFNGNISEWNVSRVIGMSQMFLNASAFTGDISEWDVSRVSTMWWMFASAESFNGDLTSWDLSRVTDMEGMFAGASNFNGDVSSWDVARVTSMSGMFWDAPSFKQNLCAWRDKFQYYAELDDMFDQSGCNIQFYPSGKFRGPFCMSFCFNATVTWSAPDYGVESIATMPSVIATYGPASFSGPTSPPVDAPTISSPDASDCVCDHLEKPSTYIQKPNTNCREFIQCSRGKMVQEFRCPDDLIFDFKYQQCSPLDPLFDVTCRRFSNFEADKPCQCQYAKTICARRILDLTAERISTWEKPIECQNAEDVCLAEAGTLYEKHRAKICREIVGPACDRGDSWSCVDEVSHCCGDVVDYACGCDKIRAACDQVNGKSCFVVANQCCGEDASCKCDNLKKSCSESLKFSSANEGLPQDCLEAEQTCCEDCGPVENLERRGIESCSCGCNFWDDFCATVPGPACRYFAGRCCGSPTVDSYNTQCYCEVYEKLNQNLNYDLNPAESCERAVESEITSTPDKEVELLLKMYNELGGEDWENNDKWDSEARHCDWHGLSCDGTGLIIGIDLSSNNLVGTMSSKFFSTMRKLTTLKLQNNTLEGTFDFNAFYQLRNLEHVDISHNLLHGEVNVLLSPRIRYFNMSHNNFSSITRFKTFRRSQQTLEQVDLGYNIIHHKISEILQDTPPNLKALVLTGNRIFGNLPDPLPALDNMERFVFNSNHMTGPIPDVSRSFPRLKELNLANQRQGNSGGLSGSIPGGWASLPDLAVLDLSNNNLTDVIPPSIGNILQLKNLNVSNNKLDGGIPAELGKLAGICEVMDMSNNNISGQIPSQFENFKGYSTSIDLSGNAGINAPAPLDLCNVTGFGLRDNGEWCPPERNILKEFYDATKGREWTESTNWLDPFSPHCQWFGVECENGSVIKLDLMNNGLSGQLNNRTSELTSLQILHLGDNDIKGTIPAAIGNLTNLTHLILSFNSFRGTIPNQLRNLQHLNVAHFHGNRLSGRMPELNVAHLQDKSSFISDCGYPTDFDDPISCSDCTICCNSNGDCHDTSPERLGALDTWGFEDYVQFLLVFIMLLLGYTFTMVIASTFYDRWKHDQEGGGEGQTAGLESTTSNGGEQLEKDQKYALESIGEDSVYSYILSKNKFDWSLSLAVVGFQTWALVHFVLAAPKDFANEKSDWVYSWKCPRNSLQCTDKSDLTAEGWWIFCILIAAHLLKDTINGLKLLLFCGKQRHDTQSRIRYYFGGFILSWITALAIYASAVYNKAIARSQTDIIINAVVIIFIVDVDEYFHKGIVAARSFWRGTGGEEEDSRDGKIAQLSQEIANIKVSLNDRNKEMKTLLQDFEWLLNVLAERLGEHPTSLLETYLEEKNRGIIQNGRIPEDQQSIWC